MSNSERIYGGPAAAVFVRGKGAAWLRQLAGLACGLAGGDGRGLGADGLFALATDAGNVAHADIHLVSARFTKRQVRLTLRTTDGRLRLISRWEHDAAAGIWRRGDRIVNTSSKPMVIRRCLSRLTFAVVCGRLYSQDSQWCRESQGGWRDLTHGGVQLACAGGRTTEGGTPYACLRDRESGRAVAIHVLPRGNWVIRVLSHTGRLAGTTVEAGLADENLRMTLRPGEGFDLPEILLQGMGDAAPEAAAPALHEHLLARDCAKAKPLSPVVYNTWFDQWDHLDPSRLRGQLAAARKIGCEMFVVDAGWYGGPAAGAWHSLVGDWREATMRAFGGRMRDFADEVRAAGLGFGLWVEPERILSAAPVAQRRPGWLIPAGRPGQFYPDLQQTAGRNWVAGHVRRLIETYDLRWMKIDFNAAIGPDPHAAELTGYYAEWYRLLDEIRGEYPHLFLEGCASGGMRLDLAGLSHWDGQFLSDNVEPVEHLRIWQGTVLRMLPGRLGRWTVLRSARAAVCPHGTTMQTAPQTILAPSTAGWERSESIDPTFSALCAMPGMLGFSGDLAGLPPDVLADLAGHVKFFKRWRRFIAGSVAELLTPVRPIQDRTGWVAVQLRSPQRDRSLVFAYRLEASAGRLLVCPRGLKDDAKYDVAAGDGAHIATASGRELATVGCTVRLDRPFTAAVLVITRRKPS